MPPAATHEEFVSSVDLMPTLLDLLGVAAPAGVDGRSWLPLLRGEAQRGRDHVITHVNTVSSGMSLPQRCIRTADWALMFHAWPDGSPKFKVEAMSGITYKALEAAGEKDPAIARRVRQLRVGEPLMFFDQKDASGERRNRISDPAQAVEIRRLGGLLLSHMERTGDPQTDAFRKAFATWERRSRKD
jgi:N-sulfoglucosamine sulfohydrolase